MYMHIAKVTMLVFKETYCSLLSAATLLTYIYQC